MKRFYLLSVILFFSLVVRAINVEIDGIMYNINVKTGLTEVAANTSHQYTGDIVIPETITYEGKEYTVTAIGQGAFSQRDITSITFPNSITSIGNSAFIYCQRLDSIVLPEKLTVIGDMCFASCESLRRVVIPEGVTLIDNSAFNSCYSLDSLIIPHSVTRIEDWAFALCKGLTYVEMSRGLTYVGRGAFGDCYALKSVLITDLSAWSMINFGDYNANPLTTTKTLKINDEEITDLIIPDDVTYIGDYAFRGCTNITSVTMGESVTRIGTSAFYGCKNCTSITIGENVTNIGGWAFYGCSAMTSLTSLPRKVPSTTSNSFDSAIKDQAILYVPSAAIEAYSSKTPWSDFYDIVTLNIPKHQLAYYVDGALYKSFTLEEGEYITPEPAPEKEGYTFSGWSEIPERMPKNDVTVTGSFTLTTKQLALDGIQYTLWVKEKTAEIVGFDVTDGFTGQVSIPSTVTKDGTSFDVTRIGDSAFSKCENLVSITLPENLLFIGESAFYGCMLEHVFVKNTGTHLNERSFSPASYNHTMLYIPKGSWSDAVYHGDFWRFINIRETVTNSDELSSKQAYTLMGANTFNYVVYDAINDTTAIRDAYYQVDENSENNCWQIIEDDDKKYLYNIGAKKFAQLNAEGLLKLTRTPNAITIDNGKNGIVFGDNIHNQWIFVVNDKVSVKDIPLDVMNRYLLTYTVDGDTLQTDSIAYGTELTLMEEPTKEGYTFSGWSELPATMPAEDVTVTGTFLVNHYLLTYTVDGVTLQTDSIAYGTELTLMAEPSKEGYTFSGWSELPATMPAEDVTVTGVFVVNRYLLTYTIDGDTLQTDSIAYGTKLTLMPEPTKEGYTFSGWSELLSTMPSHDVTITGTFSINSYKLTYLVDGEAYQTDSLLFGSEIAPAPTPEKEGYTFSGWSEIPATMPAEDVTVTGVFVVNHYLLTYTVDGDTLQTDSIAYGTELTLMEEPTKDGYTFSGWSEIPATMPAEDVTVTGTFTVNKYFIRYYVGDELVAEDEVEYGTEVVLRNYIPEDASRYSFVGWEGEKYETMPAHDIEYHANIADGIAGLAGMNGVEAFYDASGRKVAKPKRGVHVLKMKDGSVKKLIVR